MNKRDLLIRAFALLCILIMILPTNKIMAVETKPPVDIEDGKFTFTTTDTKATTSIRWKTIGFNICRVKTANPLSVPHARLMLDDDWANEVPSGNGKVDVTFTIPKDIVDRVLVKFDYDPIKEKDLIYFNGIIQVYHGTTPVGEPHETRFSIEDAENWANKDDFADRFNVPVEFHPNPAPQPVKIERLLYRSDGNHISYDIKDYEARPERTLFSTNYYGGLDSNGRETATIDGKIEYNGETHYLYRVYYHNMGEAPPRKVLGNRKTAINPNVDYNGWVSELSYVRNREFLVREGGLKVVAMYRRMPGIPEPGQDGVDTKIKQYEVVDPTAVIAADSRRNEQYEVTDGIPGTESVYVNAFSSKYIAGSTFTRRYGKKTYNVSVKKTYTLTWTETDPKTKEPIPKESVRTITYQYPVEREYSYWIVSALGVYGINNAVIENAALPGGSVTLTPIGYSPPTVSYNHN
ncbi:DUF5704 domain-containing protein, partial [Anaerocolumna sp.]|uniref:DUF5704 domain-containing protein n=1 Tax=Anaerocolumna sp. TaxID=2041569 RepID=UPI0028B05F10